MPARVLIVDPDGTSALRIARELSERGHETSVARSAEEALAIVDFAPDVVVTELQLPGISGFELVAASRERGDAPRAIFMASSPSFADCRAAWKLGVADFLAKPVDALALARAVDEATAGDARCRPTDVLELRGRSTSEDVRRSTRAVLAFALRQGALPSARARLGSAVAEILDNVRRHAYRGGAGEFRVTAQCEDGAISVRIADDGQGFDAVRARLELPAPALPPTFPSAAARGVDDPAEALPGGLVRATSLVESLSVESSRAGTRVTLRVAMTCASFECEGDQSFADVDYLDPAQAKRILHGARRGRSVDPLDLPPSIAVAIGRLLAGATPTQLAQAALWS